MPLNSANDGVQLVVVGTYTELLEELASLLLSALLEVSALLELSLLTLLSLAAELELSLAALDSELEDSSADDELLDELDGMP